MRVWGTAPTTLAWPYRVGGFTANTEQKGTLPSTPNHQQTRTRQGEQRKAQWQRGPRRAAATGARQRGCRSRLRRRCRVAWHRSGGHRSGGHRSGGHRSGGRRSGGWRIRGSLLCDVSYCATVTRSTRIAWCSATEQYQEQAQPQQRHEPANSRRGDHGVSSLFLRDGFRKGLRALQW
ncbi:MAG: hypothetical protein EI684_00745 [Candidatus Viridilinea halotolerans]|uniref:Uncharacterized protein n=1 Tax=Candidatus Viridilinea halotolerans TaxID=2491704 RepID=A0A426UBE6_9CHLR|nr:MAG: hypothetical protein EI684_00745 [Candidatus Viridilinea halotolerans]